MELETMRPEDRTAFIAIVGRPNVGKSSLLNRMLGQKVAIVSSKPQTTRTRIMGVLTEGADQLVFIDTPGLMRPRNRLGDYMVRSVTESVSGVDACLLVVEAGQKISPADLDLIEKFRSLDMPAVLAINKIDLLQDKSIKGGSMLKKVGTYAREDMERFFGCKINLQLWVKVKEGWRNSDAILRSLGYDSSSFDT